MKKRRLIKGLGVGAALTGAALGLTGCNFHPNNMEVTEVYGPPIVQDDPEYETAAPTDYDPENAAIEAVYGPPPEEGSIPVDTPEETDTAQAEDFDPETMTTVPLYGPPWDNSQSPTEETP